MSDPRLEDGAGDALPPQTSSSVFQRLIASLHAACLALDEMDDTAVACLRNNAQYIAKMGQLMLPMFDQSLASRCTAQEDTASASPTKPIAPNLNVSLKRQTSTIIKNPVPLLDPRISLSQINTVPPSMRTTMWYRQQTIATLLENRMEPDLIDIGDPWYLVSTSWWFLWNAVCEGYSAQQVGNSNEVDLHQIIGPVDNSELYDSKTKYLRRDLTNQSDLFVTVPQEVWDLFVEWCGAPKYTFMRPVRPGSDSGGTPFVQLFPRSKPTSWWISETVYPRYQRKKAIEKLSRRKKVLGERWYLVRSQWLVSWGNWMDGSESWDNDATFYPVDNTALADSLGNLASWVHLNHNLKVTFVPLEAWKLLVQWHGQPLHVFSRPVVKAKSGGLTIRVHGALV